MKREYPVAPLVGVGGVVIDQDRVLLVRRAHEPQRGEWSLPGGALEVGETLAQGVEREVREETGLAVQALAVVEVLDRIVRDSAEAGYEAASHEPGRVRYHYVLIDFLCHGAGGSLANASDADDVCWATLEDLRARQTDRVARFTMDVIEKAFRMDDQLRRDPESINKIAVATAHISAQ